jgi:hypothetical protein
MTALGKRLTKLEETLGLGPETEQQKYLRQRLDAARKRMESYGYRFTPTPRKELAGLTMAEILNRGRDRVAAKTIQDGRHEQVHG